MDFIHFHLGLAPDARGRFRSDYLRFSVDDWHACHDAVQWAFPTRTQSKYIPYAPTVPEDFVLGDYPAVQQSILELLQAFLKALNIYMGPANDGIHFTKFQYVPSPIVRVPIWMIPNDHNHLRLTRIIECLDIFDLQSFKNDFAEFLVFDLAIKYPKAFSGSTVAFWVATWENKRHLIT